MRGGIRYESDGLFGSEIHWIDFTFLKLPGLWWTVTYLFRVFIKKIPYKGKNTHLNEVTNSSNSIHVSMDSGMVISTAPDVPFLEGA
jgi:hypothetical protein